MVGDKIKEARQQHLALTQLELAAQLRSRRGRPIDPQNVSRWERGTAEPRLNYIRQIAELADLPVSWFFTENGTK